MVQPQKDPLRALSEQEEQELQRLVKATSERLDVVRRAKAVLAVAAGRPFTEAAHEAGVKSGDGVGKLVKRFNEHGLAALSIAAGAGRKPTYTYEQAEAAGIVQLNEDEAGPYQAIPQPGDSWQPEGHPVLQPHEYERRGTAKLLTLFRPATGILNAKGVLSVTNAVLHPWLKEELVVMLTEIEKAHPREGLPPEAERPLYAQWRTWLWPHESDEGLPPLRIILVLDNLAGHLSYDLVQWFA